MSRDATFANTSIILIDPWDFEPESTTDSVFNPGAANADASRIIRRDYPHESYAKLASEALLHWRSEFGANERYVEQRLLFSAAGCSMESPRREGETLNYVKNAYELSIKTTKNGKDGLKVLNSLDAIRVELRHSSSSSPEEKHESKMLRGYISDDCGWANARASIVWLRQKVLRSGRINVYVGQVESLLLSSDNQRVEGVKLIDGTSLTADLTIVAAGSRSPQVLGLPDICDVYSEVLAYIQLSEKECQELKRRNWPIIVDAQLGVFTTGPDHDNCLKLGHFSYSGMADVLASAGISSGPREDILDATPQEQWKDPKFGFGGDLPVSKDGNVLDSDRERVDKTLSDYRTFLLELLGPHSLGGTDTHAQSTDDAMLNSIAVRPFSKVRRCWYTDRPSLDFIIDYHPSYGKSLFVATGGGDHAFKFLPVIGEKIVAIVMRDRGVRSPAQNEVHSSLEELCKLWRFPDGLVENLPYDEGKHQYKTPASPQQQE
jgi:sarcosine oxidase/L-pipecolate oxidase